ncbi:hypothetical protein Ari01nite_28660 [Paractinoplanes rishiriensis]|uniref:Uncharacterized protein n=2 Tax=Paractinoplanes rishiriensis TaxID=1050105 RepID=A0A919JUF3_9ACTN|nr:hypothetical protein Ari01nite_28660 [Actinoplanes rishiriensis]
MHVVPLSGPTGAEVLVWAASAEFSRGVPEQIPDPLPLLSARDVLAALRAAGCHGTAWFKIVSDGTTEPLAECPDPHACYGTARLDLGEVRFTVAGQVEGDDGVEPEALIEAISFRKPNTAAVLAAAGALAVSGGPQLVFDDSADSLFVIWPGESAESLLAQWPW